jgi:hypothetical protein
MVDPRRVHWIEYGLLYECNGGVRLVGFIDADWAECAEDRKSTSGCCFNIGSCLVSWFNRKQRLIALRFAEAEYMATSLAACEALWLRKLFSRLFGKELEATVIHCDNQTGIRLSKDPMFHDCSKHIVIHYHFL